MKLWTVLLTAVLAFGTLDADGFLYVLDRRDDRAAFFPSRATTSEPEV